MPGIVEFQAIIDQAARQFVAIIANEPDCRHFAEYLTGLLQTACLCAIDSCVGLNSGVTVCRYLDA